MREEGPDQEPAGTSREERLLRVTGAISDGTPIDWAAEAERSPDLRDVFRRLAVIERIRDATRR